MSLQPLPGFIGYNQVIGPSNNTWGPYKMEDFKEPYYIPPMELDQFTWQIPTPLDNTFPKWLVRDEVIKYEASSDFKPLTFISLPKPKYGPGIYEQMKKPGNLVYYRTDPNKTQGYPIGIREMFTQTELKTTPMLNMSEYKKEIELIKYNAQSTSSIQNSQQG